MRKRRRRTFAASSVTPGHNAGSGRIGSGGRRVLRSGSCLGGRVTHRFFVVGRWLPAYKTIVP